MEDSDDATSDERVAELKQLVTELSERVDHLEQQNEKRAKEVAELNSRVYDLEAGEVDAEDVVEAPPEDQLPIQQLVQVRKTGGDGMTENQRRATTVWPEFYERARREAGLLKLDSEQVRSILRQKDEQHDRNTTIRVMRMLAKATNTEPDVDDPSSGQNLVRFTKKHKAVLVADRDEWQSFFEDQADALRKQASNEMSMLGQAATGGDDD